MSRWNRWLRYPEGQINALHAAAPLIAAMPPAHVARQVARLARHLSLDHPTVTEAITTALTDVIATAQDSTSPPPTGRHADRQDGPPAIVRTATREAAHTPQQAVSQTPTAMEPDPERGPAGSAHAGLHSERHPL